MTDNSEPELAGRAPSDGQQDPVNGNLQDQVDKRAAAGKKFGTFGGVFTPTLLTILGVIMYLRLGWVVGNAGLLGAWAIIGLAVGITAATGISMSSITTNIRIGAGGAFSIISQSLGLEVGGSVGIPLYLSQALAVALYVFGFRAGWLRLFPHHPPIAIDLITFAALLAIALVSASLAFRVQYVILAIVVASLVSVFASGFTGALEYQPEMWGTFSGVPQADSAMSSFWFVFAVFFPATTGIMAGANLSGELKDPRRSIPLGTLSAIAVSSVVYVALTLWLSRVATPEELTGNYTVMVDKAFSHTPVLAGLLGATFSSGLASLVGAPRILQALAIHDVLPGGEWLSRRGANGEPRNAMLLTGVIVLGALLLRDLNAIAPLITMFFLITYAMINVVVFVEQSLGLISFRPLFTAPRLVPLIGAVGSLLAMLIINPVFGFAAAAFVVAAYAVLVRRHLKAPFGDVRSGLFLSLAEWAAKRVADLHGSHERAWKPNLLVPVDDLVPLRGSFKFLRDLTSPRGSIRLVGLVSDGRSAAMEESLSAAATDFRAESVFTTWTVIVDDSYGRGLVSGIQALSRVFFRPNVVFLEVPQEPDADREDELRTVIGEARSHRLGVAVFAGHPRAGLGHERLINVWIRDQSPDWRLSMHLGNLDLALLCAHVLRSNWKGRMRVITTVGDADQVEPATVYLENLVDLARLRETKVSVVEGEFEGNLASVSQADLSIFGLSAEPDFSFFRRMVRKTSSACLFVSDSGDENVLA